MKADNRTRKILSGVKVQSSMERNRVIAALPLSGAAVARQHFSIKALSITFVLLFAIEWCCP